MMVLSQIKGSVVGPTSIQSATDVPPAEAPAVGEQPPAVDEEQAPAPEQPEETITNGKAPTIPLEEGPEG